MAVQVEAIWEALAARLEAVDGFRTVSRKRREYGIEEHPVLMVLDDDGDETRVGDPDDPVPTWRLTGELIILARSADGDRPGSPINELIANVRKALERDPAQESGFGPWSYYTDLGGKIRVLSIARVEKGAGELSGQAVARIALEMETHPA